MKFESLVESILGGEEMVVRPLPYTEGGSNVWWERRGGNLEGAPKRVVRHFWCDSRRLSSLKGGPEEVGEAYDCSFNNLKTLEGAPEKIGGGFYCSNRSLKSLKGIPEAKGYTLPGGFSEKDAKREVERRKLEKGLDTETIDTFGDFIEEL